MQRKEPIHKVTLKSGATRYRFVIDVGRKPDGRCDQKTHTYDTLKEAREERAKIVADLAKGTYVGRTKKTLGEHLEEWLNGRRKIQESTRANYRNAIKPIVEQVGHVELQKLTKAQVDQLINAMLNGGRRVETKGRPLAPATVTLALTVLAMALDDAMRWCDIDFDEDTLTICVTRIIVEGQVVHSEPKTERGKRTLPLDPGLSRGAAEAEGTLGGRTASGRHSVQPHLRARAEVHLFVDELGDPVHPESYSDRFEVLVNRTGLLTIRLHDTRHTCGTLMSLRGVPPAVISAWLGHANAAFTMKTYVHGQDPALRAAGSTLQAVYAVQ